MLLDQRSCISTKIFDIVEIFPECETRNSSARLSIHKKKCFLFLSAHRQVVLKVVYPLLPQESPITSGAILIHRDLHTKPSQHAITREEEALRLGKISTALFYVRKA